MAQAAPPSLRHWREGFSPASPFCSSVGLKPNIRSTAFSQETTRSSLDEGGLLNTKVQPSTLVFTFQNPLVRLQKDRDCASYSIANINLGCFYIVGMPVAVLLAFVMGFDFKGLWLGLMATQMSCVVAMMSVICLTDWEITGGDDESSYTNGTSIPSGDQ
ncbi:DETOXIFICATION 49 protein [Nymphaea thermarum]|nr:DETOXIFICATION 49 protein [Nymphaea thermarum]